jgi:two-component system chemotaxis response regulator CheB
MALHEAAKGSRFRPTADLLFERAATAFGTRAVGLVLSRVLNDEARGVVAINRAGGLTSLRMRIHIRILRYACRGD